MVTPLLETSRTLVGHEFETLAIAEFETKVEKPICVLLRSLRYDSRYRRWDLPSSSTN